MIQKRFLILLISLAAVLGVMGANSSFTLVPVRNVVEGRNFALTFRLTNGEGGEPEAPQLEHCTLLYGPATSTMQSVEIVNGRYTSTRTIDYTFTYRADSPGHVNVPEVTVSSKDGRLRSRAASFEILPADNPSGSNTASGNRPDRTNSQSSNQSTAQSGSSTSADLLVRVFFSKSSVYEQEPVVATIKVYTRNDITSFIPRVQPAFEGFLMEELPVSQETTLEHYNGQNYHCAVLKRLLLYPQRSGRLEVNSGKYDVTIVEYEVVNMGFFRTQRPVEREITTTSNAASIQVRPLPSPAPAGFNGAVGNFSVSTNLDPELMRTNEPSVYSYTVEGTGNIKYLRDPILELPAGMESFSPRNDIDARVIDGGANMRGTYKTEFTIVPSEVGTFTIPGTPFVYFDPSAGEYKTIEVASTDVRVLRGSSEPVSAPNRNEPAAIEDIFHIHPMPAERAAADVHYTYGSGIYWFMYGLALLILILVIIIYRRKIRAASDVAGQKLAKAGRKASKRLKAAQKYMTAHKPDEFYAAVASALWGYLSDKLSIAPSQLTTSNIAEKLEAYGLPADKASEVLSVLERCEMARFTPSGSDRQMADLYSDANAAISAIENVKK